MWTALKSLTRNNKGFIFFILGMAVFRTAVADWNPVPTGSMQPTILEGDVVLVNRLAYSVKVPLTDIELVRIGNPQRGEIATFSSPKDGVRLIKRIVAVGGDVVQMRNGVLSINGLAALYEDRQQGLLTVESGAELPVLKTREVQGDSHRFVQQLPTVTATRDFGPYEIPLDSYFMMGDNRDNSYDSRFYGPVARHLIIGRSSRILVSADMLGDWMPRFDRFGLSMVVR